MIFSIILGSITWFLKIIYRDWSLFILRYSGIFDLGMLFGWLMIAFNLIQKKYEVESFEGLHLNA
jgi:hypothetical protein